MTHLPTGAAQGELGLEWLGRSAPVVPQPSLPPLPDGLHQWVARLCSAVVEIAAGDRPAAQLYRVVRPGPLERLQRRSRVAPSRNGPVRGVSSLRLARQRPGVLEATAVVQGSARYQAVALQLRERNGRWQVTAVEIR